MAYRVGQLQTLAIIEGKSIPVVVDYIVNTPSSKVIDKITIVNIRCGVFIIYDSEWDFCILSDELLSELLSEVMEYEASLDAIVAVVDEEV